MEPELASGMLCGEEVEADHPCVAVRGEGAAWTDHDLAWAEAKIRILGEAFNGRGLGLLPGSSWACMG